MRTKDEGLPPAVNFSFGPHILLSSSSSSAPVSFKETKNRRKRRYKLRPSRPLYPIEKLYDGGRGGKQEEEERPAVTFSFSPEHDPALRRREEEEQ